jgi:hypothetical protein
MTMLMTGMGVDRALDTANLKLWLKADSGVWTDSAMTVPATADGAPVGGWSDVSGNGNHATQSNVSGKPTLKLAIRNGLPVLRFDGTSDYLDSLLAQSAPCTLFFASNATDTAGYRVVISSSNTAAGQITFSTEVTTGKADLYVAGSALVGGTNRTGWHRFTCIVNGAASKIRVDGSDEVTGSVGSATSVVRIGANDAGSYMAGDIGELLIYQGALGATQIANVEAYLAARWG